MKQLSVSERCSCALVGIWRSTYRYTSIERVDDGLAARLQEIAEAEPMVGYRTAWVYLRREGWGVNHKRVQRVWREEGLTQPLKRKRKRYTGRSAPLQATHIDHVWTYDFIHDRTEGGQPLRFLTVEDEYTREGLAVAVGRSMPAKRVIEVLKALFAERGVPEYLRSDNGPELIAIKLVEWLGRRGVQAHHIDPGSPWQNPYVESFHATLRRECLNRELFYGLVEARVKTESWRERYNNHRPHSSLGYLTPVQFREGVRIPLLERGRPSCHQRTRDLAKQRQGKQVADLYPQVVQS
jgi:putative transposase